MKIALGISTCELRGLKVLHREFCLLLFQTLERLNCYDQRLADMDHMSGHFVEQRIISFELTILLVQNKRLFLGWG